ncbi:alanine--glyoxylate aminotransferase family protein [Dehalococcoidia bacterium]|nr:alanine--glyoxylate aminotransferase family protein [Dehalococcoidia bacterium]
MNLRIPGPIPVPEDILSEMSGPMINHRGPEYKELLYSVTDRLKKVFDTQGDVYTFTSSGSGAMEAAVVNTLSPGDKVINVTVGVFGDRFGDIAKIFGANLVTLDFPHGEVIDLDRLQLELRDNPDTKAVLVTHNETSTGVANDLGAVAMVIHENSDALVLVDGISSVASLPISTDGWNCDVVASASQKGWMVPPGLAFLSFNDRAWDAHSVSKMPRFYFDISMYKSYYEMGQPPYTPAISQMFALDLALDQLLEEGMGSVFERHANIAQFTRDGVKSLGLSLFPKDAATASDTITAVSVPTGVDATRLVGKMREDHGVILAGGQESLSGKIFRIGHLGPTTQEEIQDVLDALRTVLPQVGFKGI